MVESRPIELEILSLAIGAARTGIGVPVTVSDLAYSTADVRPGTLFFCVPGSSADGHDFAAEAVARGAVALVCERPLDLPVAQLLVPDARVAMARAAGAFFGEPTRTLAVAAVTGTNGKTTTAFLLFSLLAAAGRRPGLLGTIECRVGGERRPVVHTTPEAIDLQRALREMLDAGDESCAMEASSHAAELHRLDGVRFACLVFTNLTQDHLDYHRSMEEYFQAKARLFTSAMSDRAVVNHDSAEGRRLAGSGLPTVTYGLDAGADVRATDVRTTREGLSFRVGDLEVRSALHGLFNVENCLATLATARELGIADENTVRGIGEVRGVPGRVEAVEAGQEFLVMVDYAHTPDSLENVLRTTRPLASGRLIVVFGCGGDRDRAKRRLMGRVAAALADLAVITSDNPRSEDPLAIVAEIEAGAVGSDGAYVVEVDRRAAIRLAVREAHAGDVVVIAGKGHEMYQELADRTIAFDDREVSAEEIRALRGAT